MCPVDQKLPLLARVHKRRDNTKWIDNNTDTIQYNTSIEIASTFSCIGNIKFTE